MKRVPLRGSSLETAFPSFGPVRCEARTSVAARGTLGNRMHPGHLFRIQSARFARDRHVRLGRQLPIGQIPRRDPRRTSRNQTAFEGERIGCLGRSQIDQPEAKNHSQKWTKFAVHRTLCCRRLLGVIQSRRNRSARRNFAPRHSDALYSLVITGQRVVLDEPVNSRLHGQKSWSAGSHREPLTDRFSPYPEPM